MENAQTYFCPAKINAFLAVTDRREDGFHELVSIVAPLAFGDELTVAPRPEAGFALTCDDPAVPLGGDNLVLRAAERFREQTGYAGGAAFHLVKRVPMGAGLGGGSSNAAMALRALNELADHALEPEQVHELAAEIGSDCPLFLADGPMIMRGRGEHLEPLPGQAADRLAALRLLVFKPAFGINTAWAYHTLAAGAPAGYLPKPDAEAWVKAWCHAARASVHDLGFNSLEVPAFGKFIALPTMIRQLHEVHGVRARMSGSGSACYAFLEDGVEAEAVIATVREGWGDSAWCIVTRVLRSHL